MTLRIATWNINSVRIRIPLIQQLLSMGAPDVLCLQETKVDDPLFPLDELKALGYDHIAFSGQKSYNGVAILSKLPLSNINTMCMIGNGEKRHISAELPNGTVIHNFYVPAGGDIPDPAENPKFKDKLAFVDAMTDWSQQEIKAHHKMIMVGDMNIAPGEHDVWSHKQLLKIVSHTPIEIEKMEALQAAANWVDSARQFTPADKKLYSWWSYRNRDWEKSNRGRRLDHIWVTPPLKETLKASRTISDARSWEKPSDHVPVILELAV